MLYLIVEILFCLIAAFVIGATISWLFRGLAASRRIAANDELWIKESEHRRLHLVQAETQVATKSEELVALRHEFEALRATNVGLEKEVSQARTLQESLGEARGKISELRPLAEQLKERERAARMNERELDLLRAKMDDLNTVIHDQQAALEGKNRHVVELCKQIERLEPLSTEIQLRNLTIAELRTRLRKTDKKATADEPKSKTVKDD